MLRRYVATYEYTRIVGGEPRDFVHETIIEAPNEGAANVCAFRHFDELARQGGVGWMRVLNRCGVVPAPHAAIAKGGRRVGGDRTAEE